MLKWKDLNLMSKDNDNKGKILAARLYADTTGNKCQCGGFYDKRVPHDDEPDILVPRCGQCNKYPPLFHIDADALDANGAKIRVKIRNDKDNNRLTKVSQCLVTIERIQDEVKAGSFDVNRYVSKASRETFKFKNYVQAYLAHHEDRLSKREITPKALRDKKSLINKYLVPEFGDKDLIDIKRPQIKKFHDKKDFQDKARTRDLALGELKTILRQAVKDEKLNVAPEFDKIPKAKMRKDVITREKIDQTIELIPFKIYRDMLTIMATYPLRPSELRAIRWRDVDFFAGKLFINGHFSDEIWISGRKSVAEGNKAEIDFPLIQKTIDIFRSYLPDVRAITFKDDFVFRNERGNHIQEEALSDAWRSARKKAGHAHQMYEIRHRVLTEISQRTKGDIVKMMKASGHTNANTLMSRYIRDDSDMSELFQ